MQRLFVIVLTAVILFVGWTFSGMAFFRMDHGAGSDETGCFATCLSSTEQGMDAVACVDHCLTSAVPDVAIPALAILVFVVFLFVVANERLFPGPSFIGNLRSRWREGIGKLFLHQHLSTVVLRE